ncbi:hypothetical protein OAV21_01325 [bacterium]|jgi:hypothetical protein|nr:hypothetical protein [Verrucomicrobiales bacterium]MDC0503562.1 hypothetical protein [Verrucomicrobiales bacterium]MDC3255021.1 hypothetical protein [bacterium]
MKASQILSACPLLLLLLLGGCLEPIPFDNPNYPQSRNGSLRYPQGSQPGAPRVNSDRGQSYGGNQYPTDRWNRTTPGTYPRDEQLFDQQNTRPAPTPRPAPKPPEAEPLVDIDPIEESTKPKFDYAIPVQGASNLVVSPYAKEGPYIDVSGLSSGTQIECPKTGKTVLVP